MLTRQVTAVASLATCPKTWEQVSRNVHSSLLGHTASTMLHTELTGTSVQNADDENAYRKVTAVSQLTGVPRREEDPLGSPPTAIKAAIKPHTITGSACILFNLKKVGYVQPQETA